MIWLLVVACALATLPAALRWLRVAQREHYLAGSTSRFAVRWWSHGPYNGLLLSLALVGVVGTLVSPWFGFLVVAAQTGPIGLGLTGRTSSLAWTARLKRLALVAGVLVSVFYLVGGLTNTALLVVLGLFGLPLLIDLALLTMAPIERRLGGQWVAKAATRLQTSGARVVAITGSFGKTTTKGYVTHLLAGTHRVVASPASFNNRMGLARAINEQLVPGTEIFVAEMGTYGKGEIADLCSWIPPDVAALVSVGPVHLERFKTEEAVVAAKGEIFEHAPSAVLSIDHPLLAELAGTLGSKKRVTTVSARDKSAAVTVDEGVLTVGGETVAKIPDGIFPLNLGVAFAACLALGLEVADLVGRLDGLPKTEHRLTVTRSTQGFWIIDDTYNANPEGANAGLDLLRETGSGRKALVTPGMVELGPRQVEENRRLATRAAAEVDEIVIVGTTNRRALLEGSAQGPASVTVVSTREQAVEWVRANLGEDDAVLYENDLPDHYP